MEKTNEQSDLQKAPKVDTPSMFEKLAAAIGSENDKEAPAEEAKPEPKKAEENKELNETLKLLVEDKKEEIDALKAKLSNTKDEKLKLELEKELFKKEKRFDEISKRINLDVSVDPSGVYELLDQHSIPAEGESRAIVKKMLSYKGASDLIKMYSVIAKALLADIKTAKAPNPINLDPPKSPAPSVNKVDDNSMFGQVLKSLNK